MVLYNRSRATSTFGIALCSLIFTSCGGGGTATPPPIPSTITSVTVSPASTNVLPGATQTFQVAVQGTGAFSSAVNWSVNGTLGGSGALGIITTAGVYTAPAAAPNPNTVSITATSASDSTKSGSSSAIIGKSAFDVTGVQISVFGTTVNTGWSDQLSGQVSGTGSFDPTLTWSVNNISGGNTTVGTVDSTGLYHAPSAVPQGSVVSVTAASAAYPNISATALLTIVQDTTSPPVLATISPSIADEGRIVQLTGRGFFCGLSSSPAIKVYFTGANGIQLRAAAPVNGSLPTDTSVTITVPLGATDGPVSLMAQPPNGPAFASNSVKFTRAPRIRIRAPLRDLSSGETETFHVKQIAGTTPATLVWTADVGAVTSGGVYTAPSGITGDTFATISACVQGTQYCDQQMLGIHPFRIVPDAPVVTPGQSLQLQAIQSNSILSPVWTLGGPGSLSPSGQYTAGGQPTDAGGIPFAATANNITVDGIAEVTGQIPGLVNRISADYISLNTPFGPPTPYGFTQVYSVGVANNRLYVGSTYYTYQPTDPSSAPLASLHAVDIYDLSDPIHPAWIDAFEPITAGAFTNCDGFLYMYGAAAEGSGPIDSNGEIAVYDVSSSPVPLLLTQTDNANVFVSARSGCVATSFPNLKSPGFAGGLPETFNTYQMQNGSVVKSTYSLPIPAALNVNGSWFLFGTASDGKRLYMDLQDETAANHILTYDLTTAPPSLLSTLNGDNTFIGIQLSLIGNYLYASNSGEMRVYDVTGNTPVQVADLDGGYVEGWNSTTVIGSPLYGGGLRVIDTSNPQSPTIKSALYDYSGIMFPVALSGNYAYDMLAGVGVWDISKPGGLLPTQLASASPSVPWVAFVGDGSTGFAVDSSNTGGSLIRFDLTQNPPSNAWQGFQPNVDPTSLALVGTTLYEGTTSTLMVLDASGTGAPTQVASLPIPVASLASVGNTLLVGTGDNRLVLFDISSPKSPVQQGTLSIPQSLIRSRHLAISPQSQMALEAC